ncbi:MAG TPA: Na+/H+ antiporter subunit G [Accumulibacter sp.]|jgi:multicomponent K+:H+ antiporter subunit G|nr:Na+/H+ antiporter subunit G [Accumulibacter sp.]
MNTVVECTVSLLVVVGALAVFCGAVGLARLPDFLSRLHAPTKASTLGVGALVMASTLFFSAREGHGGSVHGLAILAFLFLTAPVGAHLLAKAALHRQTPTGTDDHAGATAPNDGGTAPGGPRD